MADPLFLESIARMALGEDDEIAIQAYVVATRVPSGQELMRNQTLTCIDQQEHVLRPSGESSTNQSSRQPSSSSHTNFRSSSSAEFTVHGKAQGKFGRQSKDSPTPSIKKGKVERLLKEHGSPPGIRVTAGGRIVPDGISPLGTPRFNSQKKQYRSQWTPLVPDTHDIRAQETLKMFNGFVVTDSNGRLHQIVDGIRCPVESHNGILQFYLPPANTQHGGTTFVPFDATMGSHPYMSANYTSQTPTAAVPFSNAFSLLGRRDPAALAKDVTSMPTEKEIQGLEEAQKSLKQELKDLDRNEVLSKSSMTSAMHAQVVSKRRDLTNRLDAIRKAINASNQVLEAHSKAKENKSNTYTTNVSNSGVETALNVWRPMPGELLATPFNPNGFKMPGFTASNGPLNATFYHPIGQNLAVLYPQVHDRTHTAEISSHKQVAMKKYSHEDANQSTRSEETNPAQGNALSSPSRNAQANASTGSSINLDGSAQQSRRSHAIVIKDPKEPAASSKTALNPESPPYQPPGNDSKTVYRVASQATSLLSLSISGKETHLHKDSTAAAERPSETPVKNQAGSKFRQSSNDYDSSISTADFFPQDTKQHSAHKHDLPRQDRSMTVPGWMRRLTQSDNIGSGTMPNKFMYSHSPDSQRHVKSASDNHGSFRTPPKLSREASSEITSTPSSHQLTPAKANSGENDSAQQNCSDSKKEDSVLSKTCNEENLQTEQVAGEESNPVAIEEDGSSPRSDAYLKGYKRGYNRDTIGDDERRDYLAGYRAGLIQADLNIRVQHSALFNSSGTTLPEMSSMGKVSSAPSLASHPPTVPANSPANTPSGNTQVGQKVSPSRSAMDSPQTRADFFSKPNMTVQELVGQRLSSRHLDLVPGSTPSALSLTGRYASRGENQVSPTRLSNASTVLRANRYSPFVVNGTYGKVKPTSTGSSRHAMASFSSNRLDGGSDELNSRSAVAAEASSPPASPSKKKKIKSPSSTPIRSKFSSAAASLAQFAATLSSPKRSPSKKERAKH